MKILVRFLQFFFLSISMVFLHFAISYFLPYPFNTLNIFFVFITLLIMYWEKGVVVWIAFAAHFFIELYSGTTFGMILIAGTGATLFLYWIYRYFLTNRSWYTGVALASLSIVIYRIIYTVSMVADGWIRNEQYVTWRTMLFSYGWELLFTVLVTGVLYAFFESIPKRFRSQPRYRIIG